MKRIFTIACTVLCCASLAVTAGASAAAPKDSAGEPDRHTGEPNPLKNVYFGEEHLHTENSPDAFLIGCRGSWEDAYNWAKGNEIKLSTTGETIQKSTPLDFVAITDHAEYFGVMPALIDPNSPLSKTELAKLMIKDSNAAVNKILGT